MIDAKKVAMMTKLAIYEQGEGKEDRKMHRYNRRIYLAIRRLISFFAITIAYILTAGLYCFRYVDEIFLKGFGYDYKPLLIRLALVYVTVLIAGLFITDRIYRDRYNRMIENLKRYDHDLYHLNKYFEEEELQK